MLTRQQIRANGRDELQRQIKQAFGKLPRGKRKEIERRVHRDSWRKRDQVAIRLEKARYNAQEQSRKRNERYLKSMAEKPAGN